MSLYENNIRLKGFIGKDAEPRSASNGNSFIVFSLATNSSYKDRDSGEWVSHTDWHRVSCSGRFVDIARELHQGDYAEVEGELRSSVYEVQADNGQKVMKIRSWEVRATQVKKLERPTGSRSEPSLEGSAA
jgi:single-strand DNA-binding protein